MAVVADLVHNSARQSTASLISGRYSAEYGKRAGAAHQKSLYNRTAAGHLIYRPLKAGRIKVTKCINSSAAHIHIID